MFEKAKHPDWDENAKTTTSDRTSASGSNELLRCRVRRVGEALRPDDVVLIDDMFMPVGFSTSFDSYYAGQIVTASMSGKVIYK